jgi:hypothetical protein
MDQGKIETNRRNSMPSDEKIVVIGWWIFLGVDGMNGIVIKKGMLLQSENKRDRTGIDTRNSAV